MHLEFPFNALLETNFVRAVFSIRVNLRQFVHVKMMSLFASLSPVLLRHFIGSHYNIIIPLGK